MALVHELGHALFGTVAGGTLSYLQVAWFIIYPKLSFADQFLLGLTQVSGLSTPFQRGLLLIGGSFTTNIAAWFIGGIILKGQFGQMIRRSLKLLGWFGVLDLPFYVIFPQIGLRHWILLGGTRPEPLIGARELGLSDGFFYVAVFLTTIGLVLLYTETFEKRSFQDLRKRISVFNCLSLSIKIPNIL